MLLANFNGKEHLRHRAVSLRQHGFLVEILTFKARKWIVFPSIVWCPRSGADPSERVKSFTAAFPRILRRLSKFNLSPLTLWRHCCHMGTARPIYIYIIKHPVPDRVKQSFVIFDIRALWRSALSARMSNGNSGRQRVNLPVGYWPITIMQNDVCNSFLHWLLFATICC